jgi:hypothetical protein
LALTADDRLAIAELLSLHGHLIDSGSLDRLDELFIGDATYDLSDFTGQTLVGVAAIRAAAVALGERNPLGHHVTNVAITENSEHDVRARSKGLGVNQDGTVSTVTYEDRLVRRGAGWRIRARTVRARRTPLMP